MTQPTSSPTFFEYSQSLRSEIEAALADHTRYSAECPSHLQQAIRHSLLAPCKRLRPMLVLMAAEACGYDRVRAMPAACAVEMIHTYSLIHDDLPAMDDDDLRRGLPSCHAKFGEAVAILAGDALLAQAFQVLAEGLDDDQAVAGCCRILGQAAGATALVGGQADDLQAHTLPETIEQLEAIHRRKTGALISASMRMGGTVARATAEQLDALGTYGLKVGLAFQVVDDLLDCTGNEQALGKRIGKDSVRGKLTFPGLIGVEESRRRAAELIANACQAIECFGNRGRSLEGLAQFVLERNR